MTDRGTIACGTVVNAAGAWSRDVAALAGVKLPNEPERHEILVTEPLKPWLGPLVSNLGNGLYFSQSLRGEIVGGMGDPEEPPGIDTRSTLRFLARFSRSHLGVHPDDGGAQGHAPVGRLLRRDPRQQPRSWARPVMTTSSSSTASSATAS